MKSKNAKPNTLLTPAHKRKTAERTRNLLRELWSKSPYRSIALNLAAKSNGKIQCAECGYFHYPNDIEVDHLVEMPRATYSDVTDVDWTSFISALFCDPTTGLQVLCKKCHARKTAKYMMAIKFGADVL